MSEFTCACFDGETYTTKANCDKPEHSGKDVQICGKCRKGLKKGEITGCVIKGCGNVDAKKQQEKRFDQPEFENFQLKAGFLSFVSSGDGKENEEEAVTFSMLTLEDYIDDDKDNVKKFNIEDVRNVVTTHTVEHGFEELNNNMRKIEQLKEENQNVKEELKALEKETNDEKKQKKKEKLEKTIEYNNQEIPSLEKQNEVLQNNFAFCYGNDIPQYFGSCQLSTNTFLITGGVFYQENQIGRTQYEVSAETFLVKIKAINEYTLTAEAERVINGENQQVVMNFARIGHQVIASNDKSKIFAIGGNDLEGYHNSIEVFNKPTNTWELKAEMSTPRSRFAATLFKQYTKDREYVEKQFIYVFGGFTGFQSQDTAKTVEKYDIDENKWTVLEVQGDFNVLAGGYAFQYPGDDQVYVAGGVGQQGEPTNKLLKFIDNQDGKTCKFELIGNLKVPRSDLKGVNCISYPGMYVEKGEKGDKYECKSVEIDYQVVLYGGEDTNTVEYFVIKDNKIQKHGAQLGDIALQRSNNDTYLFRSQHILPVVGQYSKNRSCYLDYVKQQQ